MKERDARMCETRKRRHKEPAENEIGRAHV